MEYRTTHTEHYPELKYRYFSWDQALTTQIVWLLTTTYSSKIQYSQTSMRQAVTLSQILVWYWYGAHKMIFSLELRCKEMIKASDGQKEPVYSLRPQNKEPSMPGSCKEIKVGRDRFAFEIDISPRNYIVCGINSDQRSFGDEGTGSGPGFVNSPERSDQDCIFGKTLTVC